MSELRRIFDFQRQHKSIVAIMFAVIAVFASLVINESALSPYSLLYALVFTMILSHIAMRKTQEMNARMHASDSDVTWTVRVNGATVGEISDAQYAAFQYFEILNVQNYLRQLVNIMNASFNAVVEMMILAPALLLWAAVATYFLSPADFTSALTELQKITPAQASAAVPALVAAVLLCAVFVAAGAAMLGNTFGMRNKFSQAIDHQVRLHVNCAADGDVRVERNDANVAHARPVPAAS